ncbi:MauE/DoxX family redox-associated membrane protein [Chitinophaga caseinilytica]|uniref:MauE/DoxX family redox-associated membrane protein n=1 Tax=Chitinophaga caseinilytica TaxID=2267521 RepID=A0ABZ2Z3H4_9BACT
MPLSIKTRTASDLASALLLIFFLHSAIGSIAQHQTAVNVLAFYTPVNAPRHAIAWAISAWQFITAALLFFPVTRRYGLGASLGYFVALSVLAWLFPGDPAQFGGLLNHITRFQTQALALSGIAVSAAGIVLRYFSRIKKQTEIIAQ